MKPLHGLNKQIASYLKNNHAWFAKGTLTADMEWRHERGQHYGVRYLPETVGRALRHLEEMSIVAVKDDGKSVQYKYLPENYRPHYIPWSTRPDDKKDKLFHDSIETLRVPEPPRDEGIDWNERPRPQEPQENLSDKCDRLIRTIKWEIGNESHIHLRDICTKLGQERGRKTVNKKYVAELEKRIISTIEYQQKKNT